MKRALASQQEYYDQDVSKVSMADAQLENALFDRCTFSDCDFSATTLHRCKFIECEFIRCNLSLSEIARSTFREVTFTECKLVGIDWTKAGWSSLHLPESLQFYRCILDHSSFFGLYLAQCKWVECRLHDVDFAEAQCEHADFTGSDCYRATFHHTDLRSADFSHAHGYNINLFNNEIKRATFMLPEAASLLASLQITLIE